jgi:hypothetical protein
MSVLLAPITAPIERMTDAATQGQGAPKGIGA